MLNEYSFGDIYIRHAIDNGVNYLDTAFFYHSGNSESFVGKVIKDGYRNKTYIATKLPLGNVNCEEDVEKIFGKRPWTSRTEEILAINEEEKKDADPAINYKDENADIIRQKAIDAVIEKARENETTPEEE